MQVTLPYPPPILNPNASGDWRKKCEARKKYRNDCWACAMAHKKPVFPDGPMHLKITFHPKCRKRPDADNALASLKNGIDGVCLAWGINDERFNPITIFMGKVINTGSVILEVLELDQTAKDGKVVVSV